MELVLVGLVITILLIIGGLVGFQMYINHKLGLVPSMTIQDVINFTLKDNKNAVVTVGIIDGENMSYTVYGNSGEILPQFWEREGTERDLTCPLTPFRQLYR